MSGMAPVVSFAWLWIAAAAAAPCGVIAGWLAWWAVRRWRRRKASRKQIQWMLDYVNHKYPAIARAREQQFRTRP